MRRLTMLPLLAILIGCAGSSIDVGDPGERMGATPMESVVVLETSQGDIVLRFFPEIAPEHMRSFLAHSASGYYDGCTFHRVIPGFVIQGGDPNTKNDDPADDGYGGHGYLGPETTLAPEFSDRKHLRGTLSMARGQEEDSAGSQFFVCQADTPFLDGKYTVFGEVVQGLNVVDAIVHVERDERDRPLADQTILSARVEDWPIAEVERARSAMWAKEAASAP